jgi:hypothetical protein
MDERREHRVARKRGENLFQALRSTAGPSPLHAAGIPC